ncbi:MAG TPA: aminoacyl-tRNA hydrolase [Firmicutes bacterium]|nr:aminoacyl-tRNA hydrolase [Bacillota bacterium]
MDYLIVGLGNPGEEYELTRHNAGFLVVDRLKALYQVRLKQECHALCGWFNLSDDEEAPTRHRIMLAKPLTYMNLSGNAVFALINKYGFALSRVIIVYDDLSLPFGVLRIRAQGSSGGHKGIASVINRIGPVVPRLKVGIGAPPEGMSLPDYVLDKFSKTEQRMLPEITSIAGEAIITWVKKGTEKAMSIYNGIVLNPYES